MPHKINLVYNIPDSLQLDPLDVVNKNYIIYARIEGRLEIFIDNKLFFSEEGILLFEFMAALIKWLNLLRKGKYPKYEYFSMDYEDGPILEFIPIEPDKFKVFSQWQLFKFRDNLETTILLKAIDEFNISMSETLKTKYKIYVKDFL